MASRLHFPFQAATGHQTELPARYSMFVLVTLCAPLQSCPAVALWTAARQAPLSMGFSRQEYWSGLPRPLPGDLPDPEIELTSPEASALAGRFFCFFFFFTSEQPGKPCLLYT